MLLEMKKSNNYCRGPWSSGMILPLGGRGRGFDSRRAPTFLVNVDNAYV